MVTCRASIGCISCPLAGGSDPSQLPADVLLDRHGTIVDVHYGAHADDQWSVDELLARCAF